MYRRYSQANGNALSLSQMKRNRLKDLLILLLLAMLAAALVVGIPAVQQRSATRDLHIQRMRTECDEAIRQTSTLSRNAGADSAALLARIRSNIYAIRMMNTLSNAQGGGILISEDRMTTLLNTVDRYLTYLTTGMETGEYQTSLQTALEELQEALNAIK